ncbi:50S ribosomal protein L13 [Morus notabilis]|uniref:Large ribosomal subunit protein uL13c n=1 Tax=Morus notabilis TaxID=981085 RepID=W9RFX5_9ROSA|nr:50S ribosomal protein L13, chloroplastic [Morus notabilis]EXB54084.1 50S ribosomal protein L13 [Morus notabilis]
MALLSASSYSFVVSSSSLTSSSSSSSRPSINACKTPFLGFSVALSKRPWVPPTTLRFNGSEKHGKRGLTVRCVDAPHVPVDQRWLFEQSEVNGPDIWNKTWYPKAADHIPTQKPWYIVDATDKILGRLASTIAIHIRGKNLATYTPSVDMGAFVIVVNAEKVAVSGKKRTQKLYRRHSGRPGGMKVETFDQLQQRIPERIIEHAVRGMLPKGRLGRALFNHLKVYKGPDHPHTAQKPANLPIRDKRIERQR